jgi:hypothetical protein
MKRILTLILAFTAFPALLIAQATIPVSGQKVLDNNVQPLTGQLVFIVTDNADTPVTYTPQGGSASTATFTIPVVKGAVQNISGFPPTIPNPATMTPANTRYRIQVQSTGGGTTYFTLPLTNITQAFFSYDGYAVASGITITGAGLPHLPCSPHALYNDTTASNPYPWSCSQLQNDSQLAWTQNPSLNPSCPRGNDQAIASSIGSTTTFCVDANQAFVTPGFVWAGPLPGHMPTPIGLVPVSTLCASGACGTGGNPAGLTHALQFNNAGQFGGTTFQTDSTNSDILGVRNSTSSNDNGVTQAPSIDVTSMNSLLTSIGTTGSVVIPTTATPLLAAPVYNNPSSVVTTGGHLGPGTYTYVLCSVNTAGVEQKCNSAAIGSSSSNHSSVIIASGTTNVINFAFGTVTGAAHYNLYGRVAGSQGFIKTLTVGNNLSDDGSITPGAAPQQNFSNPNNVGIDDLRYGVIQHYATGVPVREYGCAEDGVTDDTVCVQAAVNYALSSGITNVDFTPGKTYKIATTSGFVALAGDDGTCPPSGSPTVGGVACTPIAAQYTMQAYSVNLHGGGIKLRLNGAKLVGNYAPGVGASPLAPAMFTCNTAPGCGQLEIDGGTNGINGASGAIQNAFIGVVMPGTYSFSSIHDVNFGNCGFPWLMQSWDSSEAHNVTATCEAGFTIGGWYDNRGNVGSSGLNPELGGYADGYQIINSRYNGLGAFLASHANVDNYFYTYIYQGQNQGNGRMVDIPGTSSPNGGGSWNSQIPYFGVFGQANNLLGRYGRQNNGPYIVNFQTKNMTRSAVVNSGQIVVGTLTNIGAEFDALCDNTAFFVGDPVNCPDPYTPNINAGFIHGIVVHVIANGVGNPAGYQAAFNNANQSTYLNVGSTPTQVDTIAPNQVALLGSNTPSLTHASVSGRIQYIDNIQGTPGTPATNTPDDWVTQVGQNPGGGVAGQGSYFDIVHPTAGVIASNIFVRVPALLLSNTPLGLCDAPTTNYTGHDGILADPRGTSGIADNPSICFKDATNTYSWHSLLSTTGRATLAAGTVTVSTIQATTTANYQLTACSVGGTQGMLSVGAVTAGASFVIHSSSTTDTSVVCWSIN